MTKIFILLLTLIGIIACQKKPTGKLPFIGESKVVNGDTILYQIPDFTFINQDGQVVNNESYSNKIYVADFFFISCPSICPKVRQQMLRIHDKYLNDDRIELISHTLDPKRDTVEALAKYADKLEVKSSKWDFVTGEKDSIYGLNEKYFVVAYEDDEAPGGIDHSGKMILVDHNRHVRGFAEGTDPESVTKFLKTIDVLLEEYPID